MQFIRCIKPNLDKLPNSFTGDFVLRQLRFVLFTTPLHALADGLSYVVHDGHV